MRIFTITWHKIHDIWTFLLGLWGGDRTVTCWLSFIALLRVLWAVLCCCPSWLPVEQTDCTIPLIYKYYRYNRLSARLEGLSFPGLKSLLRGKSRNHRITMWLCTGPRPCRGIAWDSNLSLKEKHVVFGGLFVSASGDPLLLSLDIVRQQQLKTLEALL